MLHNTDNYINLSNLSSSTAALVIKLKTLIRLPVLITSMLTLYTIKSNHTEKDFEIA